MAGEFTANWLRKWCFVLAITEQSNHKTKENAHWILNVSHYIEKRSLLVGGIVRTQLITQFASSIAINPLVFYCHKSAEIPLRTGNA